MLIDIKKYKEQGYLVIENNINEKKCNELIQRAKILVNQSKNNEVLAFHSKDNSINKDKYFLDSANNISLFYEELALDKNNNIKIKKDLAINKIGHALHEQDSVFKNFSKLLKLENISMKLGINKPFPIQSMYIFKQPKIGGEVTFHQDATFLYTKPVSVIGFWWALEDANIDNGCLWVIPGGHRKYELKKRFLKQKDNNMGYEVYDDSPWVSDEFVPLEVSRG